MSTQSALPRIIALFTPQAWMRNVATDVDPEGPVEIDVTDHILSLPRETAFALKDHSEAMDDLRDIPSAPQWIQNWHGPFEIHAEDSIQEFLGAAVPAEIYEALAHEMLQKQDVGYFDEGGDTQVRLMLDENGDAPPTAAIGAWVTVEIWVDDFAARKALAEGSKSATR